METCCKKSSENSKPRTHVPVNGTAAGVVVSKILTLPIRLLIRFYQYVISPLLGPRCRFEPTCSHYADQCLQRFGILHGSILAVKRLAKCHPWHKGGYDPVPEPNKQQIT